MKTTPIIQNMQFNQDSFRGAPSSSDTEQSNAGNGAWREKAGRVSADLAKSILADSRLLAIDAEAFGVLVMMQVWEKSGRPVPADLRSAAKMLCISPRRLDRVFEALKATQPALIVEKVGSLCTVAFGAPVEPALSETRARSARQRWDQSSFGSKQSSNVFPLQSASQSERLTRLRSAPVAPVSPVAPEIRPTIAMPSLAPAAPSSAFAPQASKGTTLLERCPNEQIRTLYNKRCVNLPKINAANTWSRLRITALNSVWMAHPDIEFWGRVFDEVEKSDFLSGRSGSWQASFDWIIKPSNLEKITEKNYRNSSNAKRSLWHQGSSADKSYGESVVDETASFLQPGPDVSDTGGFSS